MELRAGPGLGGVKAREHGRALTASVPRWARIVRVGRRRLGGNVDVDAEIHVARVAPHVASTSVHVPRGRRLRVGDDLFCAGPAPGGRLPQWLLVADAAPQYGSWPTPRHLLKDAPPGTTTTPPVLSAWRADLLDNYKRSLWSGVITLSEYYRRVREMNLDDE